MAQHFLFKSIWVKYSKGFLLKLHLFFQCWSLQMGRRLYNKTQMKNIVGYNCRRSVFLFYIKLFCHDVAQAHANSNIPHCKPQNYWNALSFDYFSYCYLFSWEDICSVYKAFIDKAQDSQAPVLFSLWNTDKNLLMWFKLILYFLITIPSFKPCQLLLSIF